MYLTKVSNDITLSQIDVRQYKYNVNGVEICMEFIESNRWNQRLSSEKEKVEKFIARHVANQKYQLKSGKRREREREGTGRRGFGGERKTNKEEEEKNDHKNEIYFQL